MPRVELADLPTGRQARILNNIVFINFRSKNNTAEVVKLADTLGSGSSGSNPVRVQIPPSAPLNHVGFSAVHSKP